MTLAQSQQMAHELTMLYLKQHPNILNTDIGNAQDTVDKIASINRKFFDAIKTNRNFDGLY